MVHNMGFDQPERCAASGRGGERVLTEERSAMGPAKGGQWDVHPGVQRYGHRGHRPVDESGNRSDSGQVSCSSDKWCRGLPEDGWNSERHQRQTEQARQSDWRRSVVGYVSAVGDA